MKSILNWRQWVIYLLFSAAFLAVAAIFSEDKRPMPEWIEVRIWLAGVAAACSILMWRLAVKWEREGKIKNLTNIDEYEG